MLGTKGKRLVGGFLLLGHLLSLGGGVTAFLPEGRATVPRSFGTLHRLRYGNDGNGSRPGNKKRQNNTRGKASNTNNKRNSSSSNNNNTRRSASNNKTNQRSKGQNQKKQQIGRPSSFAAIRKQMRQETMDKSNDTNSSKNVIDSESLGRIGRRKQQEQQQNSRRTTREERKELKLRAYQLSIDTERGFRSTTKQAKEMRALVDRLSELNPTTEPAWSYYGRTNPLTRQLYLSLNNGDEDEYDNNNNNNERMASLEGKWILTYTDVPSVISLARDSERFGLAKLGRIGQECKPFPDYTVRTVIEWKRPDWVAHLEGLGVSPPWLFGRQDSSILQKTTMKAKATPDDPASWGVSAFPSVMEVVSSAAASKGDPKKIPGTTTSFVTDDGLLALDPLQPLKIGLQMAGRGEKGLFPDDGDGEENADDNEDGASKSDAAAAATAAAGSNGLVTDDGLVALNPFQPWTVGLQMGGFSRSASEPWKAGSDENENNGKEEQTGSTKTKASSNIFEDIHERGLVEGLLKQSPIQLPGPPDALASLFEKNESGDATSERGHNGEESNPKTPARQKILYLDQDIRIIGDGQNHVTIESRACTDQDQQCWF